MSSESDPAMPPDVMAELQKEMALRGEMSRGTYLSDLDRFKQELTELQLAQTEEEKELAREKAYQHFDEIKKQELGHLEFIADKHMSFEFSFPYDSKQGAVWFMSMRSDLENTLAVEPEKGGFDGEARQWLENLYDAVVWGDGQYGVQEGLNMIGWYYGGLDAMASGLPNMKLRITATKLADAFAKDVRGEGSNEKSAIGLAVRKGKDTGERKERIEMRGKGKDRKEHRAAYAVREKESVENIREIGVKGHDEFFYWRHVVAAVAQYDYVNPSAESLLKNSVLRRGLEVEFVVQLFGERDKDGNLKLVDFGGQQTPEAILNFYTMKDTKKNRAEYRNLMQALMEVGAQDKLGLCVTVSEAGEEGVDAAKMQELINEVKAAKVEISNREKERKVTLGDRIRSLVVKQGITFDIGSANSGPLAWQFDYKKERGTARVLRRVDFGGINQAGDWYTPEFWLLHNLMYDKTARLRSKLMLPSSDRYRKKQIQEKNPFEKPLYSLEEAYKIDPWAAFDVMKVLAEDGDLVKVGEDVNGNPITMEAGKWRAKNGFRIDADVRKALKEILWFQEIPFQIGTRKDGKPHFPLYPSFIPHRFRLSFLDHIKLKDSSNVTVTLGEQLRGGQKLSAVKWEADLKEHQWDRWLVNMNMGERVLRFMAEPGDPRAQEAVLGGVGTIKETIKRCGLWLRDQYYMFDVGAGVKKEVKPFVFEVAVVSQMMILAAIKGDERGKGLKHNLISGHIKNPSLQESWEDVLSEHVMMAKYMSPDQDETEGNPEFFNETIALLMLTTGSSVYRIALEGGTNDITDQAKAKKHVKSSMPSSRRLVVRAASSVQ